jgi:AraC-like DNA-binding protein
MCYTATKKHSAEGEQTVEKLKLSWLSEVSGIQAAIYDGKTLEAAHGPIFDLRFADICVRDFILQGRDEAHPLVLMLDPGYFIGIARLGEARYVILGPAAPHTFQREKLYECCRFLISSDMMLAFCDALMRSPACSYRKFAQMVALSIDLLKNDEISVGIEQVVLCNSTQTHFESPDIHLGETRFISRENEIRHAASDWENRLFQALEQGDSERLKRTMFSNMGGQAGHMSPNPLRQERYIFVSSLTQATRAAIRGGLPPEEAYSLSDIYCQRMDAMSSVPDIGRLLFEMIQDFCERVYQVRQRPPYSQAIQKCCQYIDIHLHEPISLEDLAECCGLNRRTVSVKFKKETGLPLPDYIHREKVKEAKYLLKNTDYTIAEIGAYLQYPSQSYFTKIFKQQAGTTPQQFRTGAN